MKEKPDCDYSRAKCSTIKNADGKESYACHCIAGYTGNSTNCIGKEPFNFHKVNYIYKYVYIYFLKIHTSCSILK